MKIGDEVTVSPSLTSDPCNKRGQKCVIIEIREVTESVRVLVEFKDGTRGIYYADTMEIVQNSKRTNKNI